MRYGLASKRSLGVTASAVAVLAAVGCQTSRPRAALIGGPLERTTTPTHAPFAEPVSVATADTTPIAAPAAVGSPLAPAPLSADVPTTVSQSDVIGWAGRGVGDDVILDRLNRSGSVFHLSTGDELRLRDAGVSDDVVRAMRATAWN